MATDSKMFALDIDNVKASATSFTLTAEEVKRYIGFALSEDCVVSFNGGTQEFPLRNGIPMVLSGRIITIEVNPAAKLFLGE